MKRFSTNHIIQTTPTHPKIIPKPTLNSKEKKRKKSYCNKMSLSLLCRFYTTSAVTAHVMTGTLGLNKLQFTIFPQQPTFCFSTSMIYAFPAHPRMSQAALLGEDFWVQPLPHLHQVVGGNQKIPPEGKG